MFWYFGAQLIGGIIGTFFTYLIAAADANMIDLDSSVTRFDQIASKYALDQRTGQSWEYIVAIFSSEIVQFQTTVRCRSKVTQRLQSFDHDIVKVGQSLSLTP